MHGRLSGRLAVLAALGASLLWLTGCGNEKAEATLSGSNEVPSVDTAATGNVTAELDGDTLKVNGTFTGLSSALHEVSGSAAHVHSAPKGSNGTIFFNLTVTPNADGRSGSFTGTKSMSDSDKQVFKDGGLYVNVHTDDNPNGEIRAQLEP